VVTLEEHRAQLPRLSVEFSDWPDTELVGAGTEKRGWIRALLWVHEENVHIRENLDGS